MHGRPRAAPLTWHLRPRLGEAAGASQLFPEQSPISTLQVTEGRGTGTAPGRAARTAVLGVRWSCDRGSAGHTGAGAVGAPTSVHTPARTGGFPRTSVRTPAGKSGPSDEDTRAGGQDGSAHA